MATVEIRRPRHGAGRYRNIVIKCDGREVAQLPANQSTSFEVAPGSHEVVASMDSATSPVIQFNADQDDRIVLEARLPMKALWPLVRAGSRGTSRKRRAAMRAVDLTGTVELRIVGNG